MTDWEQKYKTCAENYKIATECNDAWLGIIMRVCKKYDAEHIQDAILQAHDRKVEEIFREHTS